MINTSKLDISYKRDHDHFLIKLQEFHETKGNPLGRIPTFGGQPLDLYALYNTVTSFGGISVVTSKKKWGQIFRTLGFPPCTNAAYALRQHYSRYLESYEKIFFFGEDADDSKDARSYTQSFKYRRLNKPPKLGQLGEPLVDNFNRISYSLQSGLQNEVDFALNICSLLSNVTNSIFNLAKSSAILDLMLGHVGIWSINDIYTKQLYKEWYLNSEKNFSKFWLKAIDEPIAKQMYIDIYVERDDIISTHHDTELFTNKEIKSQVNSSECCRVNQICIVLYNFSFEQINAMYLAQHDGAKRFLLLSSCCLYNNIRRVGLDALDNIAEFVALTGVENTFTQNLLEVLHKFLMSSDKIRRVRAMSILAKLAYKEENKQCLEQSLTEDVYKFLLETLYLPDISLILSCLDALYSLSNLSEVTATAIAMVHGGIDILMYMVTIRAESFGNKAIQGYWIVENKQSMFTHKNQNWLKAQEERRNQQIQQMPQHQQHQRMMASRLPGFQLSRPPVPAMAVPVATRPPQMILPQINPEQLVELDPEIFAAHWMSGFYEPHPSNKLFQSAIYADYINACKEIGRKGVLPITAFEQVLRSIILPPHLAQIIPVDAEGNLAISGIQRRPVPVQVHSRIPRAMYEQIMRNKTAINAPSYPVATVTNPILPSVNPVPNQVINNDQVMPISNGPDSKCTEGDKSEIKATGSPSTTGPLNNDVTKNKNLSLIELSNNLINSKSLSSVSQCQEVIDKLKAEMQGHFIQFHMHRQHIQTIQLQIQQIMQQTYVDNLPSDVIKGIQMRVQTHHQQMQSHYEKLQQLTSLSEQLQVKLKQANSSSETSSSYNTSVVASSPVQSSIPIPSPARAIPTTSGAIPTIIGATPAINLGTIQPPIYSMNQNQQIAIMPQPLQPIVQTGALYKPLLTPTSPQIKSSVNVSPQVTFQVGQSFIVPPAVPFLQQGSIVPIQHNISAFSPGFISPTNKVWHGKGGRGGKVRSPASSPHGNSPRGKGSRGGRSGKRSLPTNKLIANSNEPALTNGFAPSEHSYNSPTQMSTKFQTDVSFIYPQPGNVATINSPVNSSQLCGNVDLNRYNSATLNAYLNLNQSRTNKEMIVAPSVSKENRNNKETSLKDKGTLLEDKETLPKDKETLPKDKETLSKDGSNNETKVGNGNKETVFGNDKVKSLEASSQEEKFLQSIEKVRSLENVSNRGLQNDDKVDSMRNGSNKDTFFQNNKLNSLENGCHKEASEQNDKLKSLENGHNHETFLSNITVQSPKEKDNNKATLTYSKQTMLENGDKKENLPEHTHTSRMVQESDKLCIGESFSKQICEKNKNNLDKKEVNEEQKLSEVDYSKLNGIHLNFVNNKRKIELQSLGTSSKIKKISESDHAFTYKSKLAEHVAHQNDFLNKTNIVTVEHLEVKRSNNIKHLSTNSGNEGLVEPVLNETETNNINIDKTIKTSENIEGVMIDSNKENNFVSINKVVGLDNQVINNNSNNIQDTEKEENENKISDTQSEKAVGNNTVSNFEKAGTNISENIVASPTKTDQLNIKSQPVSRLNGLRLDLQSSNSDLITTTNKNDPLNSKVLSILSPIPSSSVCSLESMENEHHLTGLENMSPSDVFYSCSWKNCRLPSFKNAANLLAHMIQAHAPLDGRVSICKVSGCLQTQMTRGAMICHFQEKHCLIKNEDGTTSTVPVPDTVIPKGNSLKHEDESPVTRSVRFTAALILRNIARNSSYGKGLIMAHENQLAFAAMSMSEAASAAAQCLLELSKISDELHPTMDEEQNL